MKSTEEIYQALAEGFRERTGLTAGGSGDLSARFYAVAAQIYGLYAQAEWTQRQCFPQTASGKWLDLHAQLRDVYRRPAAGAEGTVRFFAGADRKEAAEIPLGTICMTGNGQRYLTTREGTIPLGATELDLPVRAVNPGADSNALSGSVIYLAVPPAGITACINPTALTGGSDEEADDALRQRVLDTYRRLANGANAAFYRQAAMENPSVAGAAVIPRSRGVGTVDVVVAAQGGMPDQGLLEELQKRFDSLREIAVDVTVRAPAAVPVDLSVTVMADSGSGFEVVSQAVRERIESMFTGKLLGQPVFQAELTALVYDTLGVLNCRVSISGGDIAADPVALPCLNSLSIEQG